MRTLLLAMILIGTGVLARPAHADMAPPPSRPEWDDTPLPMPSDPTDVGLVALGLLGVVFVGASFVGIRRREVA